MVKYILITLLQIVRRVCQWKNFENRSIIGENIDKSKVACFYGSQRIMLCIDWNKSLGAAQMLGAQQPMYDLLQRRDETTLVYIS